MQIQFRKYQKHILAIGLFLMLVLVYFSPSIINGKVLRQGDMEKFVGMVEETKKYEALAADKEESVITWTGAMFSGMPTYSLYTPGTPPNYLKILTAPLGSLDGGGGSILLVALLSFYILMCVMKVDFWLAIAGSVAFAFSSYNIIIIDAGHITKAYAIAYMPLTIAGMLLLFRQKLWGGGILFILGVAFSVMSGHIQITYYLALFCLFLYAGYVIRRVKEQKYKELMKTSAILVGGALIAILPSVGHLYANLEMGRESLRGPSELTQVTTGSTERVSTGLDIDYAFMWSYDKGETFTLMIPDFYGGSSGGELGPQSNFYKEMQRNGYQVGKTVQAPTYWGDQPFTSGPVYFGALICFLFLLGMMVVRNTIKWWILGAVLFFIILSWGRHLSVVNDFLFHYLPLYNKFRVPSMALVIPGLIFPMMAAWGLKEILTGQINQSFLRKKLFYAYAVTGGLCFLFWLLPGLFLDFTGVADSSYRLPEPFRNALTADRISLLRMDAFRSLAFITLGASLIYWYLAGKDKAKIARYVAIGTAFLVLIDLWGVDKRYLNNDHFLGAKTLQPYKMTLADQEILKDRDLSYRVLNLDNPFNETNTAYYHKSIGGYSAVKLRRYQELIDHRISGEMNMLVNAFNQLAKQGKGWENFNQVFRYTPTLNMLNTRYVIYNPGQPPLVNPYADGNAWFVQNYEIVVNADAEIAALDSIDPLVTAVIDQRFAADLTGFVIQPDSTAQIEMVSYEPMKIVYRSKVLTEQLAVFSEIYYPHGWQAYVDDQPVGHFKTDWILRGMKVPAGEHTITFKFEPQGYMTAVSIASISSLVILLLLVIVGVREIWRSVRKTEN